MIIIIVLFIIIMSNAIVILYMQVLRRFDAHTHDNVGYAAWTFYVK